MNPAKEKIRRQMLKRRLVLSRLEVKEKSLVIKEKLFKLKEFHRAGLIMFYAAFKNEVDTALMMKEAQALGKKIVLPLTAPDFQIRPYLVFDLEKDLAPSSFGILEPESIRAEEIEPSRIELIILPGIAFDQRGYRLGFGQAFYDRFLSSISLRPFCLGLGYEFQIMAKIPFDAHDEKLDMVITESHIYP